MNGAVQFMFNGFRIYVDVEVPEDTEEERIAEVATDKLRNNGIDISQLDYTWEVWL